MQKPNKLPAHKSQLASQQASLHRRATAAAHAQAHTVVGNFSSVSNIFPCLKKAPCNEITMSPRRILSQIMTTHHADTDFLYFSKLSQTYIEALLLIVFLPCYLLGTAIRTMRQTATNKCD